MAPKHEPITDDELAEIMALDTLRDDECALVLANTTPAQIQNIKVVLKLADWTPALVAEVRRLKEALKVGK